jgi:hypothetical protein
MTRKPKDVADTWSRDWAVNRDSENCNVCNFSIGTKVERVLLFNPQSHSKIMSIIYLICFNL